MTGIQVVLASQSPRRHQLLSCLFDDFATVSPQADETVRNGASPAEAVEEIACRKAKAAAAMPECAEKLIISADTLVFMDGEVFAKPESENDARGMLGRLSGRVHRVYTGVCIIRPDGGSVSFNEQTDVEFYPLSDDEINAYIATGEPMDKAGAYGIQSKGATLVKGISGDYYNVMGLPVARLKRVLDMILQKP